MTLPMAPRLTTTEAQVNSRYATRKLSLSYAHVGLYDVSARETWIAKKKMGGTPPLKISHARLIKGGGNNISVIDKDRFLCYWFHTPNTGEGLIHGYPIEWDEGHLMIRMEPQWNYRTQEMIPTIDTTKIEKNLDEQYKIGQRIYRSYIEMNPGFPISWHLMGPRPSDSMFYIERHEG